MFTTENEYLILTYEIQLHGNLVFLRCSISRIQIMQIELFIHYNVVIINTKFCVVRWQIMKILVFLKYYVHCENLVFLTKNSMILKIYTTILRLLILILYILEIRVFSKNIQHSFFCIFPTLHYTGLQKKSKMITNSRGSMSMSPETRFQIY